MAQTAEPPYDWRVAHGGAGGAGRSTAIVLFTDLVGSTELRSRLGEDAAEGLRHQHDALVSRAVEASRGHLVKNLGDGIMATFAGASNAVGAAVAVQQAIDRHNRSGGATLEVRIGISAGDVIFEEGDCFGTPVIEAARLCAAANGGQVLVSDVVRLLAGSAGAHRFTGLGTLELKGLPAPLPSFEVAWQPLPIPPLPLPSLLSVVSPIFVGREEQTEALLQLWKQARTGQRRVAFLAGEPGVGKTRLAAEFATLVHEEGALVLAGRCDEDMGVPYQPFVEALRHFVDNMAPEGLPTGLDRYGGELARLVPELAGRVPGLPAPLRSDPETERYRLFDAVAAWLGAASEKEATLFVLDDLQWAAKPTVLLLRHVVRALDRAPILIVVTYRDTDIDRRHPLGELLADLRRDQGVERYSLAGLDAAAVVGYVSAFAGHPLFDDEFARTVWRETEGNPFFIAEVLRHLTDSGAIEERDGRLVTTTPAGKLGLPEGVRDVIGRRLSRLSDGANRVLSTASVIGLEFEIAVVQAAGGFGEDDILSALDEAVASRLVGEVPGTDLRVAFAHALVRATLEDDLTTARRAALHRRVGEAIEAVHADDLDEYLPALAHHFARTGGATAWKAVEYAARAGDQAMAQLAFEAAVGHYEQALAAMPGDEKGEASRAGLLLALGTARARAGDGRAGDTYLSAADFARRAGDAETLAGAALGLADLWAFSSSVDETRIRLLEEARNALGDTSSPITAQLLARLATELHNAPGSWDRREALTAQSIDVARRLGDPRTLARTLHARNYAMWAPGGASERLALGREIVDLAHQGADPELTLQGHAWCQVSLLELGDVTGLDRALVDYERLADELRQPRYRWYAMTRRTMRALLSGDLDEAERTARAALELGRAAGQGDAENIFVAQMFQVWDERPSQEGIELSAAHAHTTEAAIAGQSLVVAFRLIHLLLLLQSPRRDEARAELEESVPFALSKLDPTFYGMGWSILATLSAAATARLGFPPAAGTLYDKLLPYAGLNAHNCGAVTFDGAYTHHLGMLAATLERWGDADEHFAAAAAMHQRMGAWAFLARTLAGVGADAPSTPGTPRR
jgi:class 3 adenylate cyclase/tetratricopeptide (TPR) repeat protein